MKKSEAATPKKKAAAKTTQAAAAEAAPPKPKAAASRKKASAPVVAASTPPGSAVTTIAARIDIGFGNVLFVRGSGPGLSWDTGVPMACAGPSLWTLDLTGAAQPILYKFLINDEIWSTGPDYAVEPGAQLEVTPLF